MLRHERREEKRLEAEARQRAREARTPSEQLALLCERGHGHCLEAINLSEQITRERN